MTLLLDSLSLCLRRMSKLVFCKVFPMTFVFKSYTINFRSLENLREVFDFSVPLLLFSSVLTEFTSLVRTLKTTSTEYQLCSDVINPMATVSLSRHFFHLPCGACLVRVKILSSTPDLICFQILTMPSQQENCPLWRLL